MAKKILTDNLLEPLVGAAAVKVDINIGDGNLMIDTLTQGEPVLASGALQYLEALGRPTHSLETSAGQTTFTLKASSKPQPWIRFPWSACNGATEWHIHLNPTVTYDITAHSDGGSVRLDLSGLSLTRLAADTGGGNMEVILPDSLAASPAGLTAAAKTGAGNLVLEVPGGIAATIHATSGLGKVIIDPPFDRIDKNTYQSPGCESAAGKVEITISSGAGNVTVKERLVPESIALS
jgi:hypothetical protein